MNDKKCDTGKHGGNREFFSDKYKISDNKIIDFSSSLNPLGINSKLKKLIKKGINRIEFYPEPDNKKMINSMSGYYDVNPKNILPGNGSADLIHLLAYTMKFKKVLIIQPNFSEYEISLRRINAGINNLTGTEDNGFKIEVNKIVSSLKEKEIIYISNPNNPAGYIYNHDELNYILRACEKEDCLFFADEAYIDFVKNGNEICMNNKIAKSRNLIVLKSCTKFYAIPGIRLGFILSNRDLIDKLKTGQSTWSVNSIAQYIGNNIKFNKAYSDKVLKFVSNEKDFIEEKLSKIEQIKYFKSEANYILCKLLSENTISNMIDYLGKKGIMVRDCSNYIGLNKQYFRIGIKKRKYNKTLLLHLVNYFKE